MSQPRQSIDIDSTHCAAICEEVGYRLGQHLKPEDMLELPPRLALLLDRLSRQDRQFQQEAPSIVPSMEEMRLSEDA